MLHLVGAVLELRLPVTHRRANSGPLNEEGATNYFAFTDSTLFVASSPTEALLRHCAEQLAKNHTPIVVAKGGGVITAQSLAENIGLADRIDIIDFEQFIATNIHEHSHFDLAARRILVQGLIANYNTLIETQEGGDGRLKIVLA